VNGNKMAAEMAEQPHVIAALAGRRLQLVERISSILPSDLSGIVLLARGSSDQPPSTAATSSSWRPAATSFLYWTRGRKELDSAA